MDRGLRDEFPNPERIGCPGPEIVAAIAAHRMPLSLAEAHLDHLTSCSPCYQDFLRLQGAYRQRRTRIIFAVAASVLIVVGVATWAMLRGHNNDQTAAVIDLRDRSMARGIEPPPTEPPLEIARSASHLDIYLPLGSSGGPYDIRVASVHNETVVSAMGEAKLEKGLTILHVDLRMSSARPGNYFLQIRRHDSEWASFALRVP